MLELLLGGLEKLQPLGICDASGSNGEAEQVGKLKMIILSKLF